MKNLFIQFVLLATVGVGTQSSAASFQSRLEVHGSNAAKIILTVAEFVGDAEVEAIKSETSHRIEGRDSEANDILDTLVRMKSRMPVLVAPPGVGKTAIVQRAIQKTITRDYPDSPAFQEGLAKAEWIQITPGRIMKIAKSTNDISKAKAIEDFFDAVISIEAELKVKVIVFMDEVHNLDPSQVEALLPYLESQGKSVRFVGATNANKLTLAFGDNEAFLRRMRTIAVQEFDDETILNLIDKSWIPTIQSKYAVQFSDEAKRRFIAFGTILNPDGGKFDAAIKVAQDFAIWNQRNKKEKILSQENLFDFFKEKTGFPVDPFNRSELRQYLDSIQKTITAKLVGQPRMIQDALDIFRDIILGTKKEMGVLAIVGPSGTGKTELGKMIAKYGFNNPRSFLKIDATEYSGENDGAFNKLFGAASGLVTSNKRVGILPEYFDDPSQGKYGGVLLIDEAERASPNFWERLMEFFEEGTFRGGDGKLRKARRHIVILTSNRGDKILFPEEMQKLEKSRVIDYANSVQESDIKKLFQIKTSGKDDFQIPVPVLNRIDRFTISVPLHADDVAEISTNFALNETLAIESLFQMSLKLDSKIVGRIGKTSFDPQYGARPTERALATFFNRIKDKILSSSEAIKDQVLTVDEEVVSADDANAVGRIAGNVLFKLKLPRLILDEPLLGSELAEKIKQFDEVVAKMIIGQDDAVKRVREAVISFLSTPKKMRGTFSVMLLGPTGVGKTELGKAVAMALFGGSSQAEIIPMGEILRESDFTTIIGSSPGYVGSLEVRRLEKALMSHPDGGVIVLDEFSNMGGKDPTVKEELIMRLYNFFEEGRWTSSATGTTYDLTKYLFVLTGNDGEELYRGISSDQIRLETWKRNNGPAVLHKMLVSKGVPEAFLGRQADIIDMKPLMRSEVKGVADKLIEPIVRRFSNLGYKVEVSENFNEQFGKMFFTQDKGARSLRSIAQVKLNALISEAVSISKASGKTANEGRWIKIEILHNLDSKPYIEDPQFLSKVEITVQVGQKSLTEISLSRDVTQFAAIDKKLSKKQALATAYHEAGHAVMNDFEVTGSKLKYVTVLGSEGNLGFALYEDAKDHNYSPTDEAKLKILLSRSLGGQVAMVMGGHAPDAGWGGDLLTARKLAQKYVSEWSLNKELLGMVIGKDDAPVFSQAQITQISASSEHLLTQSIDYTIETLAKRWDLIEAVKSKLMEDGYVTEDQFDQMKRNWIESDLGENPSAKPMRSDCAELLISRPKSGNRR